MLWGRLSSQQSANQSKDSVNSQSVSQPSQQSASQYNPVKSKQSIKGFIKQFIRQSSIPRIRPINHLTSTSTMKRTPQMTPWRASASSTRSIGGAVTRSQRSHHAALRPLTPQRVRHRHLASLVRLSALGAALAQVAASQCHRVPLQLRRRRGIPI